MGIFTASRSKLYLTTTTTPPGSYDAAGYGALTWVEVGSIESLGDFGDEASEVTFDDLADGRTKKLKGQRNAGTMQMTLGLDDTDAGQDALDDAEADDSTGDYNFKVEFPNKQAAPGSNALRYFSGKVMSVREGVGTANNVVKKNVNIGINTAIVKVASTAS